MTAFDSIDDLLAHDRLGTSGWQLIDQARIEAEVEGRTKPACTADQVLAFYP